MGKVAADSGDVVEAVRRYREALRLNADYDQAMNNLANILKVVQAKGSEGFVIVVVVVAVEVVSLYMHSSSYFTLETFNGYSVICAFSHSSNNDTNIIASPVSLPMHLLQYKENSLLYLSISHPRIRVTLMRRSTFCSRPHPCGQTSLLPG